MSPDSDRRRGSPRRISLPCAPPAADTAADILDAMRASASRVASATRGDPISTDLCGASRCDRAGAAGSVFDFDALAPRQTIAGPALVEGAMTTVLLRPGDRAVATPSAGSTSPSKPSVDARTGRSTPAEAGTRWPGSTRRPTIFLCRLPIGYDPAPMPGGWVYIMSNRPNGTLYVGTTTDVGRRTSEHREGWLMVSPRNTA
jgi:hypothetical protein